MLGSESNSRIWGPTVQVFLTRIPLWPFYRSPWFVQRGNLLFLIYRGGHVYCLCGMEILPQFPKVSPLPTSILSPVLSDPAPVIRPSCLKINGPPAGVVFSLHLYIVAGSTQALTQLSLSASIVPITVLLDIGLYYQRNIGFSRRKPFRVLQLLPDAPVSLSTVSTSWLFSLWKGLPPLGLDIELWDQWSFYISQKDDFLIPLHCWPVERWGYSNPPTCICK